MSRTSEPPVPQAEESGGRSVKSFELFFDLVFVYAFTQVTQLLAHELSWGGLAHIGDPLETIPAAALCGGLGLYLIGQIGFRMRYGGSLARPRVLTALALVAMFGASGLITALALLSAVSVTFALLVTWETVAERESRQQIRSDEAATWS